MGRYKDFDKFFAERKAECITFKMFGKVYSLPSSMPAILMVKILRSEKDSEMSPEDVINICELMVGKQQFLDLCKRGMTIEHMEGILSWASKQYGGKADTGAELPEREEDNYQYDTNFLEEEE